MLKNITIGFLMLSLVIPSVRLIINLFDANLFCANFTINLILSLLQTIIVVSLGYSIGYFIGWNFDENNYKEFYV